TLRNGRPAAMSWPVPASWWSEEFDIAEHQPPLVESRLRRGRERSPRQYGPTAGNGHEPGAAEGPGRRQDRVVRARCTSRDHCRMRDGPRVVVHGEHVVDRCFRRVAAGAQPNDGRAARDGIDDAAIAERREPAVAPSQYCLVEPGAQPPVAATGR